MSDEQLDEVLAEIFGAPVAKHAAPVEMKRKAYPSEIRSASDENRTIEVVASTEDRDRYGDIVRAKGISLANFRANPTILWAHDSRGLPVGRAVAIGVETSPRPALVARIQFATHDFARTVFDLYRGKFLNAFSIGFMPKEPPVPIVDRETGRTTGMEFTSSELLEISCVNTPANPACVQRAIDDKIILASDAERFFAAGGERNPLAEPGEPATEEDAAVLVEKFDRLESSFKRALALVPELASLRRPVAEIGARVALVYAAVRKQNQIRSVAELERLLRL